MELTRVSRPAGSRQLFPLKLSVSLLALSLGLVVIPARLGHPFWPFPAMEKAFAGNLGSRIPDQIVLSWTGSPSSTQAITWRTTTDVEKSVVQYWVMEGRQSASGAGKTTDTQVSPAESSTTTGTSAIFQSDLGVMRIHEVNLTGLKPGTRYAYRVGDGTADGWSPVYTFVTAVQQPQQVSVLVAGDSQSLPTNYSLWQKVLQTAVHDETPEDFLVQTGDLVDAGAEEQHWESWFAAGRGVLEGLPEMPALGNHENARGGAGYFTAHFQLPTNGPEGLKELAYSFDYGDVHWIVLDSEATSWSAREQQLQWLEADLQAAKDRLWKVVVFHRTPYEVKRWRPNSDLVNFYVPLFDRYHVDLVLSGHDHSYARSYPLRQGQVAKATPTDLTQGTVYIVTGRSGVKTYTDTYQPDWAAAFASGVPQPNYLNLIFSGRTVRIINRYLDGTVTDDVVLSK